MIFIPSGGGDGFGDSLKDILLGLLIVVPISLFIAGLIYAVVILAFLGLEAITT